MKILKRPLEYLIPWSHKLTCKDCKAELEIDASDVRYEPVAPAGEFGGGFCYINCGVCKAMNALSKDEIRKDVAEEAEGRGRQR